MSSATRASSSPRRSIAAQTAALSDDSESPTVVGRAGATVVIACALSHTRAALEAQLKRKTPILPPLDLVDEVRVGAVKGLQTCVAQRGWTTSPRPLGRAGWTPYGGYTSRLA